LVYVDGDPREKPDHCLLKVRVFIQAIGSLVWIVARGE